MAFLLPKPTNHRAGPSVCASIHVCNGDELAMAGWKIVCSLSDGGALR